MVISVKGKPEVATSVVISNETDKDYSEIYLKADSYGVMVKMENDEVTEDNYTSYYIKVGGTYRLPTTELYDSDTEYFSLKDAVAVTDDYYPLTWTIKTVKMVQ